MYTRAAGPASLHDVVVFALRAEDGAEHYKDRHGLGERGDGGVVGEVG